MREDQKTADDYQRNTWKKDKSNPDNEYALKCEKCIKNMVPKHNVHTNALLFQIYKCECIIIDRHVIVRDKRLKESVVHKSKGMTELNAAHLKLAILSSILTLIDGSQN